MVRWVELLPSREVVPGSSPGPDHGSGRTAVLTTLNKVPFPGGQGSRQPITVVQQQDGCPIKRASEDPGPHRFILHIPVLDGLGLGLTGGS